ncbi:DNA/RNA helicase domain-containing protein [Streptomyces sp. NPDC059578]|uniref:DNA/RNA helicase domain-containing protein n=1 Tax=Streptomyces sp. NPDC059578 TaxID=3346874 RepID=UPI003693A102
MAFLRMSARTLGLTDPESLAEQLAERSRSVLFREPPKGERRAWRNSLPALAQALCDAGLEEVEVLLEYQMPLSSLRADAVLAGTHPETGKPSYVVIELKQWEEARLIPGTADLCWLSSGGSQARLHPVAQVRQYCEYLRDFTAVLDDANSHVTGVAYLHNAQDRNVTELLGMGDERAHLFTDSSRGELIRHLQTQISPLDGALEADLLLDSPAIPGQQLMRVAADEILNGGNFRLMDEQQVAVSLVKRAIGISRQSDRKEVIVVSGGPGSGKSLIALHLMGYLGRNRRSVVHATGSKSFTTTLRHVVGQKNNGLAKLFRYFLDFRNAEKNALDVIICDEAHRIRHQVGKSNSPDVHRSMRSQVAELIDAARVPVFLLDEHQIVRPGEMGSVREIGAAAETRGCAVRRVNLNEQFRSGGSRAYEEWVLRLLGLELGGPVCWNPEPNFELLLADSPQQLEAHLRRWQDAGSTARMTAGFCWPWSEPRRDGTLVDDIVIGDWRRPWNVKGEREVSGGPPSSLWATEQGGIGQVGCIYTAQGFEYAWNGTIFGPDLVWRDNGWQAVKAECEDSSLERATPQEFSRLIRNRYKVLLTRGLAGTVLYSTDPETQAKFRTLIPGGTAP